MSNENTVTSSHTGVLNLSREVFEPCSLACTVWQYVIQNEDAIYSDLG